MACRPAKEAKEVLLRDLWMMIPLMRTVPQGRRGNQKDFLRFFRFLRNPGACLDCVPGITSLRALWPEAGGYGPVNRIDKQMGTARTATRRPGDRLQPPAPSAGDVPSPVRSSLQDVLGGQPDRDHSRSRVEGKCWR